MRRRVAFDLDCPESEVRLVRLQTFETLGVVPSAIGAQGCGRRATYVAHWNGPWVLNTRGGEAAVLAAPSRPAPVVVPARAP